MKRLRNLLTVVMILAMILTLSVTALAAGPYTITIDNGAAGEDYTAYKIFDVTVNAGATAFSYTIKNTDAWWTDIVETEPDANGIYTSHGLKFTPTTTPNLYTVSEGTGFNKADFAAFLATKTSTKTADGSITNYNSSTNNIISVTDLGYYFVTTSLGSLCSLDTTATDVTIHEKNSVPSITKEVQEDDAAGTYDDSANLDVIDTVHYKLTVNTGSNGYGTGTGVDANYVIVDNLPAGFEYKGNSIVVSDSNSETWDMGTGDYTCVYDSLTRTLTITLRYDGTKLKDLDQNRNIFITYDATMTASDVTYGAGGNTNTATLTYKDQSLSDTATVKTYEIGGANFTKVDGTTSDPLSGVKFILSREAVGGGSMVYAEVNGSGYLTEWKTTEAGATALETDEYGHITVKGLDEGTYTLTETETLAGYNLLTDTITVVVASDGTVTYKLTNGTGTATPTITVENNTGTELPSTGGIGTTIFYIIGGILVVGAGVLLITKKRMKADED